MIRQLTNWSASSEELFSTNLKKIILTLFNALVRSHLEYCIQFWSPYNKRNIDKLERIQRKVTIMTPRLQNKPYEERLRELNFFSLSKRRLLGVQIEEFKNFLGFDNISLNNYVTTDFTNSTRNNGFKIINKRFRSNEAKHIFLIES